MRVLDQSTTGPLAVIDRLLGNRTARLGYLAALTVLLTPRSKMFPQPGLDLGWTTGLATARSLGLRHGDQISFTFGPWGWLSVPTFTSRAGLAMALIFAAVAAGSYVAAMWLLLRRVFRPSTSAIVLLLGALPVAQWLATDELLLVTVLCMAYLNLRPETSGGWGIAVMSGLAASMLQVKFSTGLLATLALAVTVVGSLNRPRRAASAVVIYVAVTGAAWIVAERRTGGFLTWLDHSLEHASDYAGAMSLYPDRTTDLVLFGLVGIGTIALAVARQRTSDDPALTRIAAVVLAALSVFAGLRMGFVRHEVARVITAFHVVVLTWIASTTVSGPPRRLARMLAPIAISAVYLASPDIGVIRNIGDLANWPQRLALWIEPADIVASGGSAARSAEEARRTGRDSFALSDTMLAAIGDRGVQVDPWETTLPWTYGLRWAPIPAFQTYVAVGDELDVMNERAARSRTTEEPVLINTESTFAVDDRPAIWASPRYQLALTCDFAPERIEGPWELWGRRSTTACGEPVTIGTGTVAAGEQLTLPMEGDGLTTIRFTPTTSAVDRLFALAFKPRQPVLLTVGDRQLQNPHGLSGAPLLVSCPDRIESGRFDLLCPSPRTITFSHSGRYTLERIPFRP